MIETNARAHVDRVTRRILDSLDGQARDYLRKIAKHESCPTSGHRWSTLGLVGPNGHQPAIENIISQAERYRALGATGRKRAA